ncbi:MAG: DUF349 domain-containing protein [Bacteroidia bacterium]|nr:MAG: DUF349 domain-containing protein [Bacteroidia bacterium]
MKTNDEIDPLKDKIPQEQQPETKQIKPLKEEKERPQEAKVQETESSSPAESQVSEPKPATAEPEPLVAETEPASPEPEPTVAETEPAGPEPEPTVTETEPASPEPEPDTKESAPINEAVGAPVSVKFRSTRFSDQLIDDSEEQLTNAVYDDVLEHSEHEVEEEQTVNYSLLSKEDLVKLLRDKLDNPGKGNIRKEVEEIKAFFYAKVEAVVEEKKKHFLDEGGNLEDFKPAEEPVEADMKELLHKYRGLKAEFTKQLEKLKQENLQKKQEILEEFRLMMEGQDTFEHTFRKFKDLQKAWFAAGVVPHQNLKDLWDSYNYFVDKFNDYVRINRDLRALDLKKNLELKIQLCERAEKLSEEPNIVHAFKVLQKNHARWREIGPVPRENRDEVWDRFKEATSVINKKHQDYHSRLKESLHENLEKKTELCLRIETIAERNYETHGAWIDKTNQVLEIQKTWKTIGYAPKKDNNVIYARFRKACDVFFGNKAKFYASAFEEQKGNLKQKSEIAERAEALSTSEDWKETTTELILLQKQWKEIGPVPRRDSDKLWRRFRAACDTFFHNKSKYFEDVDSSFDENLKAKESLISEMDAFTVSGNQKKDLKDLDDFQRRFNANGFVHSDKKEWIKDQFRVVQEKLLEKIGLDESELSIFKFRYRIEGMLNAPRADLKLNFERDKLVNKLQQLRNDMGVWENNIGFFKQSDSTEETILGFQEKIDSAHERIRVLEKKIRLLDTMENEN